MGIVVTVQVEDLGGLYLRIFERKWELIFYLGMGCLFRNNPFSMNSHLRCVLTQTKTNVSTREESIYITVLCFMRKEPFGIEYSNI